MFQINDRVTINDPRSTDHGKAGRVVAIDSNANHPYQVKIDGDPDLFWYHQTMLEPEGDDTIPHDFDQGFGIGGLGRHTEKPFVPTITQMQRLERIEAQAIYCRKCGQSDIIDGAMFTTDAHSGLCDDCYG